MERTTPDLDRVLARIPAPPSSGSPWNAPFERLMGAAYAIRMATLFRPSIADAIAPAPVVPADLLDLVKRMGDPTVVTGRVRDPLETAHHRRVRFWLQSFYTYSGVDRLAAVPDGLFAVLATVEPELQAFLNAELGERRDWRSATGAVERFARTNRSRALHLLARHEPTCFYLLGTRIPPRWWTQRLTNCHEICVIRQIRDAEIAPFDRFEEAPHSATDQLTVPELPILLNGFELVTEAYAELLNRYRL